ncbi:MAG: hypothetical protein ACR2QO_25155 [Acidimicrobiales bacterium]
MTAVLEQRTPHKPTGHRDRLAGNAVARQPGRPWRRIVVDSLLLLTIIASIVSLAAGTIVWHVVAGGAFAAMAAVHVNLNWKWIKSVAGRGLPRGRTRRNATVDAVLAVTVVALVISGIAPWLGILSPLAALHGAAAVVLLGTTVVHLVQHRRWIGRAAGLSKPAPQVRRSDPTLVRRRITA